MFTRSRLNAAELIPAAPAPDRARPGPRPDPEIAAFQAAVTGSGPAELREAAMRQARVFFAGRDVTTLEISSGWMAFPRPPGFHALITVRGVIGGPEARCPGCFAMASLAGDGKLLAAHDLPGSSYSCAGSGRPDYAAAPAALRAEMEAEQRGSLERDEEAIQRPGRDDADNYVLRQRLRQRRDLLREWAEASPAS
jgi:hypothetical protein